MGFEDCPDSVLKDGDLTFYRYPVSVERLLTGNKGVKPSFESVEIGLIVGVEGEPFGTA